MCSDTGLSKSKSPLIKALPIFCSAVILLCSLWLFHPIFSRGYLIYRDQPVTLAMAQSAVKNLFPSGDFFGGWEQSNCAGYPNLLYYSKAGLWLIGVLHFISGISVNSAHKIAVFLSLVAAPAAAFLCLRRICGDIFAMFFGLVFLLQDNHIYYALNGQWNYSLGMAGAMVLISACLRFLERFSWRNAGMVAILWAVLMYTHLYAAIGGTIFAAVVFALALIRHNRRLCGMLQIAAAGSVGALMMVPYLWAIVKTAGWLGSSGVGETPQADRLGGLAGVFFFMEDMFKHGPWLVNFAGNLAFAMAVLLFALAVSGVVMKRSRRFIYPLVVAYLVTVISFVLSSGFWLNWASIADYPFLAYTKIHGYRFMLFARFGMLLAAAFGARFLIDWADRRKKRLLPFIQYLVPGVLSLFLVVNVPGFFNGDNPRRSRSLMATSQQLEFAGDLAVVRRWLRENASDEGVRVFFQDTLGNFKLKRTKHMDGWSRPIQLEEWIADDKGYFSHLMAPVVFSTGVPQAGSWTGGNLWPVERYLVSESGRLFGKSVEETDILALVIKDKYLQQFNIKYMVTCGLPLKSKLEGSGLFNREFESGSFTIFSLSGEFFQPGWVSLWPAELGEVSKTDVLRDRIEVELETYRPGTSLLIKVAQHPFWRATVDGDPVEISMSETGLMELVDLPEGEHKIVLEFKADNPLCIALAAAGLAGAIVMVVLARVKKSS